MADCDIGAVRCVNRIDEAMAREIFRELIDSAPVA
jgi:hypothetical protein